MTEIIQHITDLIAVNFLAAFAFYSICYFLAKTLLKDTTFIREFDNSAVRLMVWIGTFWVVLKLIGIFIFFYQMEQEVNGSLFNQHLKWFAQNSWFQFLLWLLLTQLLRIPLLRKSLLYRITMSLLFIFPLEIIDIILISFDRGHLSNIWPLNLGLTEIIIGVTTKTLLFILIVSAYHFGIKKIKTMNSEKKIEATKD